MNNTEVILISQFQLPYPKIASWTTMYNQILAKESHSFNHIVCPKVKTKASKVSYQFLRDVSISDKLKNKLFDPKSRYNNYLEALENIIEVDKKYIIHIIDNSGVVLSIDAYLKEKYNRKDFFIQYYYHGFAPLFSRKIGQPFLNAIDEIFFLTNLSYKAHLNFYNDCTFKARVISNGVDSKKFHTINTQETLQLRQEFGVEKGRTVFLWCSQDRPKKGLHIVLEAFNKLYQKDKNVHLLIVGIDTEINQQGVTVIGRVPNDELPKYYQIADVYLFPSLWKEGFGIVLAEALKCGCYCIASKQGGIPEVLNYGEYGVLIEHPNFIDEWVVEMNKAVEVLKTNGKNPYLKAIPQNLYDIEDWAKKIDLYLEEAKASINSISPKYR
ncbi:glycosyltransferase family 4 protein [Winogradskyella sp.]|uniref:glycosyltransferase family 4 protein n=1 Tax=Winogradskyella sp. TaxID=1883156 RepID=UPI0025F04AB7|nr:glycosyltransferase family 4 protein [Winogradskyella sp.]